MSPFLSLERRAGPRGADPDHLAWWCRAATPRYFLLDGQALPGRSTGPATTPPARSSTRWRPRSASATPVARWWTAWPSSGDAAAFTFSLAAHQGPVRCARLLLLRAQDHGHPDRPGAGSACRCADPAQPAAGGARPAGLVPPHRRGLAARAAATSWWSATSPAVVAASGGVAANRELRRRLDGVGRGRTGIPVLLPPLALTTDNAAMIARAGQLARCRPASSTTRSPSAPTPAPPSSSPARVGATGSDRTDRPWAADCSQVVYVSWRLR